MPSLTLGMSPRGPIATVALLVSSPRRQALVEHNLPVPGPVLVDLLVDTGASSTCIDGSCFSTLGISSTGVVHVHTPSTGASPIALPQYDVDLVIPMSNGQFVPIGTLPVTASSFHQQGISGLLGRDVLNHGVLVYNGSFGQFILSF